MISVLFVVVSTEFVCTNLDFKTLDLGSCVLLLVHLYTHFTYCEVWVLSS